MSAYEKASQMADLRGCSILEAAYALLGLGSLNIYEVEEIESAETARVPAATEE